MYDPRKLSLQQLDFLVDYLRSLKIVQDNFWVEDTDDNWNHWHQKLYNVTEGQKRRFFALSYKKKEKELVKFLEQFKIKKYVYENTNEAPF